MRTTTKVLISSSVTAVLIGTVLQKHYMTDVPFWCIPLTILFCGYFPTYADGSANSGARAGPHTAAFVSHPLWRFVWVRVLGMPLCETVWSENHFEGKSRTAEEDDAQRFIFCSHPHGVSSAHHIGPMISPAVCEPGQAFCDIHPGASPVVRRDLSASVLFRIPFLRELMLVAGCVDANRRVAERMLRAGHSLAILVGGEHEQLLAQKGQHTVLAMKRKGHVKLALRFGIPLVPCYCFGEVDTYTTSSFLLPLRLWLVKNLGVAIPIAVGRSWLLPFCPKPVKLVHCVGKPIDPYPKGQPKSLPDKPTPEAIDALHARYIEGLKEVFDTNKGANGYPNAVLKVV